MTKRIIAAMMAVSLCAAAATQAAINATGDVNPPDPATWTDSTIGRIGDTGAGSVTVDGGSDLLAGGGGLGYEAGSMGEVTVDGAGSTWTNTGGLRVGYRFGDGTLAITAGGAVSNGDGIIGEFPTATGTVTVDGAGSTWTNSGHFYVGQMGDGTLDIASGGVVSCRWGDIAGWINSTGVVTVSGAGSTLTSYYGLEVGRIGDGTLNITDGGYVHSGGPSFIANSDDATGAVTADGLGSTWNISGDLYVGNRGDAMLSLTGGGLVEVGGCTSVAAEASSTGAINFDNGTLTTREFLCASDSLSGTGTINTKGIVSDVDLVFDATHGMTQSFTINGPGQNITVNLDVDGYRQMGAGYGGEGTMRIADGVALQSSEGFLGYKSGSTGTVTVAGAGSAWTISDDLYVGQDGEGALSIVDGGSVSSDDWSVIANGSGSAGVVTVSGVGSTWTASDSLCVGDKGNGTLNIADGGLVTVIGGTVVASKAGSAGAINFDNGTLTTGGLLSASDSLTGTGTINTNGLVSDVHLVFDATQGLIQSFTLSGPGRNITVNLDVDGSGPMGAGYGGDGSMNIADGSAMQSSHGYLGYRAGSTGLVTVNGEGSAWTISDRLWVGSNGSGTLTVVTGGLVTVNTTYIGSGAGSAGVVTVSGAGSTWQNSAQDFLPLSGRLGVGHNGSGTLNISAGGTVISSYGFIATAVFGVPDPSSCSTGVARVSGEDSIWTIWRGLTIGSDGSGALNIDDGGLVSVGRGWAESLAINGNDDFINMTSGGMLAVYGQADDSLANFLTDLVEGVDENLRYWDGSSWESLTAATPGVDYSLAFYDAGDLAGYTVLTVVPEPATLSLLALAGAAVLRNRRK